MDTGYWISKKRLMFAMNAASVAWTVGLKPRDIVQETTEHSLRYYDWRQYQFWTLLPHWEKAQ